VSSTSWSGREEPPRLLPSGWGSSFFICHGPRLCDIVVRGARRAFAFREGLAHSTSWIGMGRVFLGLHEAGLDPSLLCAYQPAYPPQN
jgi:hypothetical protein